MAGLTSRDREPAADPSEIAEEELESRFRRRILMLAARRLGSSTTAEDVAQETLKRVMEALCAGRLQEPEALPAFVFQTARHVCQQLQRKEEREIGRCVDYRTKTADGLCGMSCRISSPPNDVGAFRLSCGGVSVTDAVAHIGVFKVKDVASGDVDTTDLTADSGAANDDGTQFRYDGDGQYIFNLSTKDFDAPATYQILVMLDDDTRHDIVFSLRP